MMTERLLKILLFSSLLLIIITGVGLFGLSESAFAAEGELEQNLFLEQNIAPGDQPGVSSGLVSCGRAGQNPCTPCDIFVLVQNILTFLWWYISVPLATLMFIYGGFLMIVPGVGGEKSAATLTKGKAVITKAAFGLLLVFVAWLLMDAIIKILVGTQQVGGDETAKIGALGEFGPWNEIKCAPSTPPQQQSTNLFNIGPVTDVLVGTARNIGQTIGLVSPGVPRPGNCPGCINFTQTYGIPCKDGCQVNSDLARRLRVLDDELKQAGFTSSWRVTEAYPPTVVHRDECHKIGTCIDAGAVGTANGSINWIKAYIAAADKVGLRVEYEVSTPARYVELKNSIPGAVTGQSSGVRLLAGGGITGEHFSVYMR